MRIIEITTNAARRRVIELGQISRHVSYQNGVIAVSSSFAEDNVALLSYDTGATLRTLTTGNLVSDVALTTDGAHLFVADDRCNITKFEVGSGTVVSVFPTGMLSTTRLLAGNGITMTSFMPPMSLKVVLDGGECVCHPTVRAVFQVVAIAFLNHDLLVKTFDGALYVIRDQWFDSLRGAWVVACTCTHSAR
jgi:hypothetical protein